MARGIKNWIRENLNEILEKQRKFKGKMEKYRTFLGKSFNPFRSSKRRPPTNEYLHIILEINNIIFCSLANFLKLLREIQAKTPQN